jgi:putative transposase
MVEQFHLSERRACRLVGLSRDSYRNPPQETEVNQALSAKIIEITHVRRRLGYRRIHDLLRPEFDGVNHKRVLRLYQEANLSVRKRKKAKRPASERVPLQLARAVNEVWSMDFVSDSLASGRRIKFLTVADDFSHECVQIGADFGISGEYVTRLLDETARFRGYPLAVRTDNGPEFTSRAFMAWAQVHGIRHILIEPGRPMQNGYIESFNGKFRDAPSSSNCAGTAAAARGPRADGLPCSAQPAAALPRPGALSTCSASAPRAKSAGAPKARTAMDTLRRASAFRRGQR